MIDLKQLLLRGSATAVITAAAFTAAHAQQAAAQAPATVAAADDVETINSSASRVELKGFDSPTPVSVIGLESINRDAKVEIGDEIRELPQIRGGQGINSGSNSRNVAQGDTAIDTLSLRNLGANRNLVLFDRQRIVSSTIQVTQVDLATIPQSVISRVDVVTGGASAAWGSDAVTGVINLVINKTFEGFKGSASYSNNTEVDHQVYKAEAAWGTTFLGGKAHTLVAGTFTISNDAVFRGQLPNDGRAFVYNSAYCASGGVSYTGATGTCAAPTGAPLLTYAFNTGSATTSSGGLINSNTAGAAGSGLGTNGLKGTQFVGTGAVSAVPFNYGTVYNNSICYNGCSNNVQTGLTPWDPMPAAPYHSAVFFNYTSYQITPDITASVQLNYSRLSTRTFGGERQSSSVSIYADNPYLPANIQQAFVCNPAITACGAGTTTLSNGYNPYTQQNEIGTLTLAQRQARPTQSLVTGNDFLNNAQATGSGSTTNQPNYSLDNLCSAIGVPCSYANKAMMRGVFSLDGVLSDNWTWNAYVQNGTLRMAQAATSNSITARLNNAMDAVRVTSGNVGASGLPIGSIQCRGVLNPSLASTTKGIPVADEIAGCAPMNAFGYQNISASAFNYIEPSAANPSGGILNRNLFIISQTTGAGTLNGVLPWHLAAGDIGIATGVEYRLEQAGQYNTDVRTQNTGYGVGNVIPFSGHYHVEEGFVEVDAPILKNNFVNSLDISMGGRLTSYSTSGLVETWKLGATSQLNDDFKVRMTWSYDIRAPSVWDLYTPGGPAGITCHGLDGNGPANSCFNVTGGNPNLAPEKSNTISAGVVMTPSWIDGLTASVDWYQIHLHGGITTPSQASILSNCRAGIQVFCDQITYKPGQPGVIDSIFSTRVNAALLTTAGLDFMVAYGFDLFTGTMDLTFNGNYTYDFSQDLNAQVYQGAGATGGFYSGGPKFQGTLNANYREGAWSFGAQARITGDSVRDLGTEGVPNLTYQSVTYTRVGGVDVPTVSGGQQGAGITAYNYNAIRIPLDLRASYKWDGNITLFGAVDNIQNLPTDALLRRAYRVGVRFSY